MPRPQITYDFDYGERFSYVVFRAADVELYSESRQGLYAWYARVLEKTDPLTNMTSYDKVFASRKMSVEAKGNLGEVYKGVVTKCSVLGGDVPGLYNAVSAASTVFCPPLYIGISNDVKGRLSQHLKSLEAVLRSVAPQDAGLESSNEEELDTEAESSVFGERVGKILRANGIANETLLFIKVIYTDNLSRADLRKTETYVNRVFVPMCGRR